MKDNCRHHLLRADFHRFPLISAIFLLVFSLFGAVHEVLLTNGSRQKALQSFQELLASRKHTKTMEKDV